METKEEKLNFMINKLDWLIGLEFVDKDEIAASKLVVRLLKNEVKNDSKL